MKKLVLALLLAFLPAGAGAAPLQYSLYVGGIPLAMLDIDTRVAGARYETRARFTPRGWLQPFLRTEGEFRAAGDWTGTGPRPRDFSYALQGKEPRMTRMAFDAAGAPVSVTADPPFDPKPWQVDIAEVGAAFDPATAAALLTAPRAEACRLDMRVFDGRKLHRIALSPAGPGAGQRAAGIARCTGRYERLAGFKAKHMTPERRAYDFTADIETLGDGGHRPVHIWAETPFGVASAVLGGG